MSIEKIIHFVQSSNYEQMHSSGAKVQLLRQAIGEYQSSLGLQRLEWTKQNVVGKFIATKEYDLKNQQLFDLLDNHGVLSKVVRIKLNKLNESEKLSLQEFRTAGNQYLRFSPIRANSGSREEEFCAYRKNITNNNIYWLLDQWKHHKRIYSSFVKQWESIRNLAFKGMLRMNQHKVTLPVGKLSVVIPDPNIDADAAYRMGGKQLLQRSGKIDMEQVKLYAARGYFSLSQVYELLHLQNIETKYLLLTLTSERNMMEGLVQQNNRHSWINLQSEVAWEF
ncbi:hypothetical protein [Paenibacillus xylanivorans]|uniref:Uncharacterized protein n=1 Tax=Paenibacillus xylanivorans TaxID=1705561 RepID=A0A0M9BPY4_9BACL|nr:hypothetical protein [Paenibacillus xylanivorans]KOY16708.1 hypothetical protein AMS66_09910 [Paenibacillus xylanivorans]